MSVETAFQAQCDHLAAYRQATVTGITSRSHLWSMVDASGDETYENIVKGLTITNVDTDLDNGVISGRIGDWFQLHDTYFSGTALSTVDGALSSYLWRVSQRFNEMFYTHFNRYLTLSNVFPAADLAMGTFAYTGPVFAAGSAVDTAVAGMGKLRVVVANQAIGAGTNLVMSITCKREDDTTVAIAATLLSNAIVGTAAILGEQGLSGNAASGQKVILVAATAQFKAAEKVLIEDDNAAEWGTVDTIISNTSITLTENLRNTYTTAASAKVTPLFKDVTACTASTGNAGDDVTFGVAPDRTVALS